MPVGRTHIGNLSRNVYFIGFMGVGKTTVVRKLARVLHVASVDTDMYVERRFGRSAARVFADEGEAAFRAMERKALRECSSMGPLLISCGEGIADCAENRKLIAKSGFCVFLSADIEHSASRIRSLRTRPLYAQTDDIAALLESRMPYYKDLADVVIDVSGKPTGWVADAVERALVEAGVYSKGAI